MPCPSSVVARPFLPARDFALSKAFYEALGFTMLLDGDVAVFSCGGTGGFVLQDYFQAEWAGNFMMQLMVDDLAAWWAHIEGLDLSGRFGVQAPRPPKLQDWGLQVAYVFDPSGVLWHVCQRREGEAADGA